MFSFSFIHAADVHLDSPLHRLAAYPGVPAEDIRHASRRALENLVDLALQETVDFVLIAGDLFDGDWKDYNTGLYFVSQVRRLKDAGIDLLMVAGNHDAAGRMTRALPYPDNVHLFSHRVPETKTIDRLGVAVHGRSFATPAVMDNLALGYPDPVPGRFNIGLLHTSLTGREGHEPYAPCTLDDLTNRGYDYWALGHVHQYEMAGREPPVVFPGCIQGRHVRENGAKGCVLVTVAEDAPAAVVRHSLDVIRWEQVTVDLHRAETETACLDRFKNALAAAVDRHGERTVIARVVFTGRTAAHGMLAGNPAYWKEAVRSGALAEFGERAWIEKVKVRTRPEKRGKTERPDPGPLLELEQVVTDLGQSDDALLGLGDDLSSLFAKLPAEYRNGADALRPDDTERLRDILDQAHAALIRGLGKEAGDENP